MNTKVRALIWEECRVSGVLALYNLALGALFFALSLFEDSSVPWKNGNDDFAFCIVLGFPLLSALLFVLGMDNSGHLTMGYPRRILNLPVHTHTTVTVTLAFRTLFLLLLGFGLLGICALRFGQAPWSAAILFVASLYVLIQLFDWLRQPVSGLASLLLVSVLALLVLLLGNMYDVMLSLVKMDWNIYWALLCVGILFSTGLGISILSVSATRRGKRFGPPELWELPALWTRNRHARQASFNSPLDAEVWFERKRSPLVMPGLTLLIFALLFSVAWISGGKSSVLANQDLWNIHSKFDLSLMASFLLAAIGYGMYRGAFWRKRVSTPHMIPYLYPAATEEITRARIGAGAIQAGAALLLMGLAYQGSFLLRLNGYATGVFEAALGEGYATWREMIWSFLSPLFLVGLISWAFLWPNRLLAFYFVIPMGVTIVALICGKEKYAEFISCLLIIPIIAFAAFRAWRRGLMPGRALAGVCGAWLLLAWLLYPMDMLASFAQEDFSIYEGVSSLAWASLGPMPYIGMLFSINRKRHGQRGPQNPLQHARRISGYRVRTALAIAGIVALSLWLKWPVEPAWHTYLHEKGFATSLRELDERYAQVPDDENLALRYQAAWEKLGACTAKLTTKLSADHTEYKDADGIPIGSVQRFFGQLPIMGIGGSFFESISPQSYLNDPASESISPTQAQTAQTYWDAVGKEVAPMLHAAAESGLTRSRYPIDLSQIEINNPPHLGELGRLANLLRLEALMACMNDRPHDAAEAIRAMFPLASSLESEPFLPSKRQYSSIRLLIVEALQHSLDHLSMDNSDLAELDNCLATTQSLENQALLYEQAAVGQGLDSLIPNSYGLVRYRNTLRKADTPLFPWRLGKPPIHEMMFYIHNLNRIENSYSETGPARLQRTGFLRQEFAEPTYFPRVFFYSILGMYSPDAHKEISNTQTNIDLARVGIAVERYRLAAGHFPERLEELVPAYIKAIPKDFFAPRRTAPLRYLLNSDGSCVVYSVGMNRQDDGGVPSVSKYMKCDDIPFSLLPPGKRTSLAPPDKAVAPSTYLNK